MPAAALTTPADVVKTRLQAERRAGQTHYKGLFNALVTIPKEEGMKALFKGWSARVIVSARCWGCSLSGRGADQEDLLGLVEIESSVWSDVGGLRDAEEELPSEFKPMIRVQGCASTLTTTPLPSLPPCSTHGARPQLLHLPSTASGNHQTCRESAPGMD